MSLKVQLTTQSLEILAGQEPVWHLILTNTGQSPIEIIHPESGEGMTSLRVMALVLGEETFIRSQPDPEDILMPVLLPPGGTLETDISFAGRYAFDTPGDYGVSAVYFYNQGRHQAESRPLRLRVRHYAVSRLHLAGVRTSAVDAVYINPAQEPPELHLAQFQIEAGGGLERLRIVSDIHLAADPVVSVPCFGQSADSHWLAWENQKSIHFVWLDAESIKVEKNMPQPQGFSRLARPACITPPMEENSGETGHFLLLVDAEEPGQFMIQTVTAAVSQGDMAIHAGGIRKLPTAMPQWLTNLFLGNGSQLALFYTDTSPGLSLCLAPWPGSDPRLEPFTRLMTWEDTLVTADALVADGTLIYGAHLAWSNSGGELTLDLVAWQYDIATAEWKEKRDILPWSPLHPVGRAVVKVRPDGVPVVLIRPDEYKWTLWDSRDKSMTPLPPPCFQTRRPIDLAFYNSEVMLIYAAHGGGFGLKKMDGSDLPQLFF